MPTYSRCAEDVRQRRKGLGQERTNDDTWNGQMMTLGQERTNDDIWNRFGKCLGNVWELFGTFLPCKSISYVFFWEMFGKCLGNVWEMFGNFRGDFKGFS